MTPLPFWFDEIFEDNYRIGLMVKETLFQGRSDFQKVEVFDTVGFGRVLVLDGLFMTTERDEYFYHEMLVHPAMVTAPKIERIMVVGGGDGGTVREVLTYDEVKQVQMVEIDPLVVEVSKKFLRKIGSAWDDPRLRVDFLDAREYVETAGVEPYDVIFLDGSDPVGPAEVLFTPEFYANCKRLLAPNGVFALQSESQFNMEEIFLSIQQKLRRVFGEVHPYFGPAPIYASGDWSWTFATEAVDRFAIQEDRAAFQETRCKHYNRDIHRGAFALPNHLKKKLHSI